MSTIEPMRESKLGLLKTRISYWQTMVNIAVGRGDPVDQRFANDHLAKLLEIQRKTEKGGITTVQEISEA